ncbi:MAG: aminotransferase class I/II-fold pyridoxal phosphate-dependent enzyme [Longimicrobiales bacterium]|nr:aminotransferase class I/II-fold pyridoxal phosphate-dependent enzyme [Longimicrobiales bacterium]
MADQDKTATDDGSKITTAPGSATDAGRSVEPMHGRRAVDPLDYDYTNFYFGSGEDAFALLSPFKDWWDQVHPVGYYQYELPLHTAPSTRVDVRDTKTGDLRQNLINFASYNYLGLSYRDEVKEAIKEAVDIYGGGSSGSPILSGTTRLHEELEAEVAAFKDKEACLVFPTGYSANIGVIAGLMRSGDLIVADQFAHASIVDGMILSKAKSKFFRHNRVDDLDRKLAGFEGKKLVIVEGVYSMDGDLANLPAIMEVAKKHGARVLIDEAHSTFVFGENGRGVAEHFGLDSEVDIHIGTFSKSLGGQGGFVAGSQELIDYLRGFSRSRFFSCALAPTVVAGILAALRIARREPELRTRLMDNVGYMQKRLRDAGVDVGDSDSQVIPIMVRRDSLMFQIGEDLFREGIFINPVKYPAVGKHKSRFRMSISAAHTREDLAEGAEIITRVLKRHGIVD